MEYVLYGALALVALVYLSVALGKYLSPYDPKTGKLKPGRAPHP